jgi:hypothetical protein
MTIPSDPALSRTPGLGRLVRTTLFILLLSVALAVYGAEPAPYEGYEQDRALLRDTYRPPKSRTNASSVKAIQAAHRLFTKLTFVGLTRERVLAILGDPKTISDYGVAALGTPDSPLTYRFDSGLGGWQFVIEFQRGVATKVKKQSGE